MPFLPPLLKEPANVLPHELLYELLQQLTGSGEGLWEPPNLSLVSQKRETTRTVVVSTVGPS